MLGRGFPATRALIAAGAVTELTRRALASRPEGLTRSGSIRPEEAEAPTTAGPNWTRTNYRGHPVDLREGPAVAAGLSAAMALTGDASQRIGAVVAVAGAGACGLVDDLAEQGSTKGLRGHIGALAHGRVTTGGLKVLGIGAAGLFAATLDNRRSGSGWSSGGQIVIDGALIAASANLINLLDLRPGRAWKAAGLAAFAAGAGAESRPVAAAIAGCGAVMAADDLTERAMLGDAGANALGAALGIAATRSLPPAGRAILLAGLGALTVASERVSFSRFIADHRLTRHLDEWGRQP